MTTTAGITGTTPAKLNLGLEVISRRPDGYHDVVTILQAISLVDRFVYEPTGFEFEYFGPPSIDPAGDMVRGVFDRADVQDRWSGRLTLEKQIPVAAGLGGGSSNAAFALRISYPEATVSELRTMAGAIGSDVPFFVEGGTMLATGTGTQLRPLPTPEMWFVLVVPRVLIEQKTSRLYAGLQAADFSSGRCVLEAAEAIAPGSVLRSPLPNAFSRQMRDIPEVERAWNALHSAGAQAIMLSGAGPAIFAPTANEEMARDIVSRIPSDAGDSMLAKSMSSHANDPIVERLGMALSGHRDR